MPSHWPIRTKLKLGLGLLLVTVVSLFVSACYGLYAYRGLVKSLSDRSAELPLASKIHQHVSELRVALGRANDCRRLPHGIDAGSEKNFDAEPYSSSWDVRNLHNNYNTLYKQIVVAVENYRLQLNKHDTNRNSRL